MIASTVRSRIANWLSPKAVTEQQYAALTVRSGELAQAHRRAHNADADALMGQVFGYVAICAERVATHAGRVPLCLYKPADTEANTLRFGEKSVRARRSARRATAATKRWLRSGEAGAKAAALSRGIDDLEEVTRHPILDLLAQPNPYMTGEGFRAIQLVWRQIAGSSYSIWESEGGRPVSAIHPLMPQFVRVIPGEDTLVRGFLYGRNETTQQEFPPDEVWWTRLIPSPWSPTEGMGRLRGVFTDQQIFAALNQYELASLDNQGRPDAIASLEGGMLGKEEREALEQVFDSKHRGVHNARRVLFLNGKMTFAPLNFQPKDMGLEAIRQSRTQTILAAFGVPESEIWMNDANLASSRTGNLQYLRQTVMPLAAQDADAFTSDIVQGAFGMVGWVLAPENVVPEDEDAITIRRTSYVNSGIQTINEARGEMGMEPVEGGDVPRINGTSIEALDAVATAPPMGGFGIPPAFAASGEPTDAKQAEPTADDPEPEPDPMPEPTPDPTPEPAKCCDHDHEDTQADSWTKDAARWLNRGPAAKGGPALEDDSPFRDDIPATATLYEVIGDGLDDRRDEILAAMRDKPFGLDKSARWPSRSKASTDEIVATLLRAWGVTDQEARRQWIEQLDGLSEESITELFRDGAELGVRAIVEAGGEEFEVLPILEDPLAVEVFTDHRQLFIQGLAEVDQTTASAVETALRSGLEDGETLTEITARVREVFDATDPAGNRRNEIRAAMVARTETADAQVQGQRAAWKGSRAVRGYGFQVAPNACQFCDAAARDFAGRAIGLDDPMYPKGSVIEGTEGGRLKIDWRDTIVPLHPNCRCTVVPVI
jgi:HK97 family phage portal protein